MIFRLYSIMALRQSLLNSQSSGQQSPQKQPQNQLKTRGPLFRSSLSLQPSSNCVAIIKRFEGLRLRQYKDAVNLPTIGYGHLLTPADAEQWEEITECQAEEILCQDIRRISKAMAPLIKAPITQSMYDALVSFSFNLGVGKLRSSTLLKKINREEFVGASEEFKKWAFAGGRRLKGLQLRRDAEANLFMLDGIV